LNGRVHRENEFDEKLGAWFRRDHPGRNFPSWVAGELERSPEEDPGHEAEWKKFAGYKKGSIKIDLDPIDWVGALIHLEPFDAKAELTPFEEDLGMFSETTGLRKPARFPLGIPAVGAENSEYRSALRELRAPEDDSKKKKR
jgi:hypothetical protein